MKDYLGEFDVDINDTGFKDYDKSDWAMYWIGSYGQIDGDHHKTWVLDQVARILNGTPVIIKMAKWKGGHEEYRVWLDDPSKEYNEWVEMMIDGGDYSYDVGTAP